MTSATAIGAATNMDLQLPDRLHTTRDLLMRSLAPHPLEKAPAIPADLAADLAARFAPRSVVAAKAPAISLIERIRFFFAAPGFGMTAALVMLIGVAVPMLTQPDAGLPDTFRGGNAATLSAEGVRIVLVGKDSGIASELRDSGKFEISAISTEATTATAAAIAGPKVVVDFTAGTITAINSYGATVHAANIPASDVASAVADAISRL